MKILPIFSVIAGGLLLAACTTVGADTHPQRCYRTYHKVPAPVSVPCKTSDMTGQSSSEAQPAQASGNAS